MNRHKTTLIQLVFILIFFLLLIQLTIYISQDNNSQTINQNIFVDTIPPACGELKFFELSRELTNSEKLLNNSRIIQTYISNSSTNVMQDNDLRGFLDGTFKKAWAQVTQNHTRVGRRANDPAYGEHELFRTIQKWEAITPPSSGILQDIELKISVESGHTSEVIIYLYSVNKTWVPGSGGVLRNNLSVPNKGEVWWLEKSYKEELWALPGVGFASNSHPNADTPATPLAFYHYKPGEKQISFKSTQLKNYASSQISNKKPLHFLIRLESQTEDTPGIKLQFYSGDYSHEHTKNIRPSIIATWALLNVTNEHVHSLILPQGEKLNFSTPIKNTINKQILVDFKSTNCKTPIYIRENNGSPWRSLPRNIKLENDDGNFELISGFNPTALNKHFQATIHDTWITSNPPDQQQVFWHFRSPSGNIQTVKSEYKGDYDWKVNFLFDEPGLWHYWWTAEFTDKPYTSNSTKITVYVESIVDVITMLEKLKHEIIQAGITDKDTLHFRSTRKFNALERSLMSMLTPEQYQSPDFKSSRILLNSIRELMSGEPIPETIPHTNWKLW